MHGISLGADLDFIQFDKKLFWGCGHFLTQNNEAYIGSPVLVSRIMSAPLAHKEKAPETLRSSVL